MSAVALGASILERHFTDDMNRPGPDISCSMDPSSLKDLINGSQTIFLERGGEKKPIEQESQTMAFAFASVVAVKDINPGDEYQYTSGTVLETSLGTMKGSYQMINDSENYFDAIIPEFVLTIPRVIH